MAEGGCSLTTGLVAGWESVVLQNDLLRVTVLPGKGADIHELVDLESGIDALFKAPWGLQPPGGEPREGSDGVEFLENYQGGWQELLPNVNDACTYDGAQIPFHGEVATAAVGLGGRSGRRRGSRRSALDALPDHAVLARARHAAGAGAARARARARPSETSPTGPRTSSGATTASSGRRSSSEAAGSSCRPRRSSRGRRSGRTPPGSRPGKPRPGRAPAFAPAERSTCATSRAPRPAATTTCTSPASKAGRSP